MFRPALMTGAAAAALAGLVAAAGPAGAAVHPVAGHRAPAKQAASTVANWPMFRGGPSHSGVSPETAISSANAATLTPGWTATLSGPSYTSPAVAANHTLGKALVYVGAKGALSAYPSTGGAAQWTYKVGKGHGSIEASPAVYKGAVYFATTSGAVVALNDTTGALICQFKTHQAIQAAPTVVRAADKSGPVIYVGTDPTGAPGAEWAIYGAKNKHGGCKEDWAYTGWPIAPGGSWSSPAFGKDAAKIPLLVFGSRDPDDSIYALNATTGALVWRYNTNTQANYDVGASPTISAPGNNGFPDGVVYVTGKDKITYAVDLTTGALIWSTPLAKSTNGDLSSTALAGDTLFVGSDSGVYALNATTGAIVWQVQSQFTFYGSPVVAGPAGQQVVIIANNEGRIYALNPADGSVLYTTRPSTKGYWASPAVSQGAIYLVGLDGVLRSYAPPGA